MRKQQSDGTVILAVILIGLGVLFFIGQFVRFSIWDWVWPFFIIVPGLAMFVPVMNRREAGLAVPASLVTGTGLILLYQSITDDWGSWAYVWTLYGVFLGFGMWLMGRIRGETSTEQTGKNFMMIGFAGFVVFGLFFGGLFRGGVVWALILIGLGAWFLFRAMGGRVEGLTRVITPKTSAPARPTPPAPPQTEVAAPPEPPAPVVETKPVGTSPRDILADDPIAREVAEALAGEALRTEAAPSAVKIAVEGEPETKPASAGVPPVSEAVAPVPEAVTPVSGAVEPVDTAAQLTADIEAEIDAAAAAARDMIGGDGDEEEPDGKGE